MTIQLSVLIWTIICFCLLMLILNKLLFGPMLRFMDARQERIQRAREKQQQDQAACEEARLALQEAQAEAEKLRTRQEEQLVAQAREKAEQQLAQAREAHEQEIAAYARTLEQERSELKTKLDASVDTLAIAYANRLAS